MSHACTKGPLSAHLAPAPSLLSTGHAHLEPGAHLTPPAPLASKDVPPVDLRPKLDPNCPRRKRQMNGTCPHPSVLVWLLWPGADLSLQAWCLATSVGAGLILCLVLETSLSLTSLQTSLPPGQGHGCTGSSREGTRWMLSDSEVPGGHLSGSGEALLSILALTVCPGGREREKERHRVYPCHLLNRASHASPLLSLVSFTLHSKAGVGGGACPHPH